MNQVLKVISGFLEKLGNALEAHHKCSNQHHKHVTEQLDRMETMIMSNQDHINALAAQLDKATTEIKNEIENLKAQPGSEQLDFSALDAKVQLLDDLNPDAPTGEDTLPGAGGETEA